MNILFLNSKVVFEIIGYLGSFFVLASFLLKDIRQIRMINIIGAVFFVIYGISTKTWATAFMNLALVGVHIFYLIKLHLDSKKEKSDTMDDNDLLN